MSLADLMIHTYLRGEDELAKSIATTIIDRLWQTRDQKLEKDQPTRRHQEVSAARLILAELGQPEP